MPPRDAHNSAGVSVLIVENDRDLLEILEYGLRSEGIPTVWTAADGESAVSLMYRHRPDFLLLDYRLRGLTGEAVAKATRELSPRTRIVVYSGVLSSAPTWADAFWVKPEIEPLFTFFREKAS